MESTSQPNRQKAATLFLAALTWFAVVLQLFITEGTFLNFISYFTILSNLLVALTLTYFSLWPYTKLGIYFSSVKTQSAVALYIFIVGLVYNFVLRGIWQPTGWQLIADNLLHVAVPVFYVFYWFVFIPKGVLTWTDGITWVYFPLAYLIYSLIRGHFTEWYPYPFLNVKEIGYEKVLFNSGLMVVAFMTMGLFLIMINRNLKRTK